MICTECGEMTNDFVIINGKAYCKDCCFECEHCGEWHLNEERQDVKMHYGSTDTVCEYCFDNYYYQCEDCGLYMTEEDEVYIEAEEKSICTTCRERYYTQCEDCGTIIRIGSHWHRTTYDGRDICQDCRYEHYFCCENCGEIFPEDEVYMYDGEYYCDECYRNVKENEDIYNYHEFNDFTRRTLGGDDEYLFGFELEVAGDCDYASDVKELLDNDAVLMHDGSVDGFEIVTQPMSKEYFDKIFKKKLDKTLEFLRENDFKGHNKGGLHVHISGLSYGQIAQMTKIIYGNEKDKNMWLCITQRKKEHMHWCSMDTTIRNFEDIRENGVIIDNYWYHEKRYTAINKDDRTGTYELRIFNSNIRLERFLKNFECVLALCDYTKLYERYDKPMCNTKGFISYVLQNGLFYPNLYAYMEERNMANRYGIEYTEEELEVA